MVLLQDRDFFSNRVKSPLVHCCYRVALKCCCPFGVKLVSTNSFQCFFHKISLPHYCCACKIDFMLILTLLGIRGRGSSTQLFYINLYADSFTAQKSHKRVEHRIVIIKPCLLCSFTRPIFIFCFLYISGNGECHLCEFLQSLPLERAMHRLQITTDN